jgi:glycosyltransferase involved in cell wall biosynthesis
MVCGRPAIVSDRVGCAADLVTAGVTGATFPFGDTAQLAQCLVELAADSSRLAAMGEKARQRVLKEYSVEKAVDGTLRAVSYVLRS